MSHTDQHVAELCGTLGRCIAVKSAGGRDGLGCMCLSGCGHVQWDTVFARRQLFCVYKFGFFCLLPGEKVNVNRYTEKLIELSGPILVDLKDCPVGESSQK